MRVCGLKFMKECYTFVSVWNELTMRTAQTKRHLHGYEANKSRD